MKMYNTTKQLIAHVINFLFSCLVVTSNMSCQSNPENPDVVIVGATPSGITAAISAARMGSELVVLEQSDHIGGVISYFDDISVDDPDFEAFQFVGALGGVSGYVASAIFKCKIGLSFKLI